MKICEMENSLEIPRQLGVPAGRGDQPVLVGIGARGVRWV